MNRKQLEEALVYAKKEKVKCEKYLSYLGTGDEAKDTRDMFKDIVEHQETIIQALEEKLNSLEGVYVVKGKLPDNLEIRTCEAVLIDTNPWKPIETAPKDGTAILATNGNITGVCSWESSFYSEKSCRHYLEGFVGGGFFCEIHETRNGCSVCEGEYPTHWMPLPEAPNVE